MNYIFALIIPLIFIGSFAYAIRKNVKVYESFTTGVKGAVPLILSIFPYIAAVTMLCKLLEVSGLETMLTKWLSPVFASMGIPTEIAPLVFIKPLSGSGSIAVIADVLTRYGVDSYVARCACVAYGSAETIFYIGAVYFAGLKRKTLPAALAISLVSYLASVVFGCLLCRIL